MDSLRAFLGTKSQGISYFKNVWHAPLIATDNVSHSSPRQFPLSSFDDDWLMFPVRVHNQLTITNKKEDGFCLLDLRNWRPKNRLRVG
jgi:hypothetical protein